VLDARPRGYGRAVHTNPLSIPVELLKDVEERRTKHASRPAAAPLVDSIVQRISDVIGFYRAAYGRHPLPFT
jgi:hypothetical protein